MLRKATARAHLEPTMRVGAVTDVVEDDVTVERKVRLLDLTTKDGVDIAAVEVVVTAATERKLEVRAKALARRPKAGVATDVVEEVVVEDMVLLALMDLTRMEAPTMVLPDTATTVAEASADAAVDGAVPGDAVAHSAAASIP